MIERLRRHRGLGDAPESELRWFAERAVLRRFEPGDPVAPRGARADEGVFGLEVVLSGRIANRRDRAGGPRKMIEWEAGDMTGVLPFSRFTVAVGDTTAEVASETLSLDPRHFPELIRECPKITEACVHTMLDRTRVFKAGDLQDEKILSLGKLSAGLAHELNNPASAIVRSARLLESSMREADRAARELASVGLSRDQLNAVDTIRAACSKESTSLSLSPLERADREDEIADWLDSHGADDSAVDALTETSVTIDALDALAEHLEGDALDAALDWVAAGCAVRLLAAENERAGTRISELVSAMKRLTHMDRAPTSEPIEVERGVRDTLTVLGHKARAKSLSLKIDVAPDLPRVHAVGGELEQVWMNLIDNAMDAAPEGGTVTVTAATEGRAVVVRVVDDGHGIPADVRDRIFDPFFTTKPQGEGTGLGLDIARGHLRRHGGDIDFDSRPGRTEFRVSLPLPGPASPQAAERGDA
jgi:signal transduction histidine kinase